MPTLAVAKKFLFQLIGKDYTEQEFDNLCFEFGVELDDVTSEKEIFLREQGKVTKKLTKEEQKAYDEKVASLSTEELYKIDTPANRYDILCPEGMAIALRVFQGLMPSPKMKVLPPQYTMTVKKSVINVRDYVVCAVLRNITFTPDRYASFIDFQEKLHSGLARKRTLVSVGTHDLDKCKAPFSYQATPKAELKFVPLNQDGKVLDCAGEGLTNFYKEDKHIGRYTSIISNFDNYPNITDAEGTILSLPPIINSDHSRIDLKTKNVFIECTAVDHHKAHVLVNQMVSAFSWYCDEKFSVEAVKVEYEEAVDVVGKKLKEELTPNMADVLMTVSVKHINSRVGVNIDAEKVATLLTKMQYTTKVVDEDTVEVGVPPCRSDVLHPCDIVEDVAIAYGYDNLELVACPTSSYGTQTPMNKLTHLLRLEVAAAGYTEMLTFSLCSRDEAFAWLGRTDDDVAVHIGNPQTIEFQVVRPSLLPGTLKTLQQNKGSALPLKLFEITDVVHHKPEHRIGAENERHFCAVHVEADSSAFQDIQGVVEYTMTKLGVAKGAAPGSSIVAQPQEGRWYFMEKHQDGAFFEPLASQRVVLCEAKEGKVTQTPIGVLGVIHPRTLQHFEYPFPCSYCEINLEPFREL